MHNLLNEYISICTRKVNFIEDGTKFTNRNIIPVFEIGVKLISSVTGCPGAKIYVLIYSGA